MSYNLLSLVTQILLSSTAWKEAFGHGASFDGRCDKCAIDRLARGPERASDESRLEAVAIALPRFCELRSEDSYHLTLLQPIMEQQTLGGSGIEDLAIGGAVSGHGRSSTGDMTYNLLFLVKQVG